MSPKALDPQTAPLADSAGTGSAHAVEQEFPNSQWELIRLCVRITQVLGLPRSIGEIFGFIFTSSAPVTFDDIVRGAAVSNGSASHGLRFLRRFGAIRVSYRARDRRDFYEPETSLENLLSGFLAEKVLFHMRAADERLRALYQQAASAETPRNATLAARIGTLQTWHEQTGRAIAAALETLKGEKAEIGKAEG